MPSPTGNATHDSKVIAAEATRQVALKTATTQAAVKTADLAYHRSVRASCLANGIQPGQAIEALYELGQGGV